MAISKGHIVEYYDSCEIDYRWMWDLANSRSMHFGYWDDGVRNLGEALQRQNELLARQAAITAEDRVLDAGCGVGGSSLYLAQSTGCSVVGISISAGQIARANRFAEEEGLSDRVRFSQQDFTKTDFPDDSFSVVWAVESVCHAEDKADFLREAFRLLRPGGRLILCDGFESRPEYSHEEAALMQRWVHGWAVDQLANAESFEAQARQAGFASIQFQNITENVLPSSRRLYRMASFSLFFGRIAETLRLRSQIQTQNIVAARDQHLALQRGLWHYGMFYGEVPQAN